MRNSEHQKKSVNHFFAGVDNDINPQMSSEKKGFAYDLYNMSIRFEDSGQYVLQKIKGEVEQNQNIPQDTDYRCIGCCEVTGWIDDTFSDVELKYVAFWAKNDNSVGGIITVNEEKRGFHR